MASYTVQARVQTRVRAVDPGRTAPSGSRPAATTSTSDTAMGDREPVDLTPIEGVFERIRIVWAQTTFFLFDGDSWRR